MPAATEATSLKEPKPPAKEYYGYTADEWQMVPLKLMGIMVIVFGIQGMNDCPAIPTLPIFMIVFGSYNLVYDVVKFVWKTERPENKGAPALPFLPSAQRTCPPRSPR